MRQRRQGAPAPQSSRTWSAFFTKICKRCRPATKIFAWLDQVGPRGAQYRILRTARQVQRLRDLCYLYRFKDQTSYAIGTGEAHKVHQLRKNSRSWSAFYINIRERSRPATKIIAWLDQVGPRGAQYRSYGQHGKCNGCETCATSIDSKTKRHMRLELVMRSTPEAPAPQKSRTWSAFYINIRERSRPATKIIAWLDQVRPGGDSSASCGQGKCNGCETCATSIYSNTKRHMRLELVMRSTPEAPASQKFANLVSFLHKYSRTKSSSNEDNRMAGPSTTWWRQ